MTDKPVMMDDMAVSPELNGSGTHSPKVHTTQKGVKVTILGLSPLLIRRVGEAFDAKNPEPMPPTYEVDTAGGGKETHYHQKPDLDKGIKGTLDTTEEWDAWNVYEAAHEVWREARQHRILVLLVKKGLDFEMPADESWIEDQALFDVEVPEGELERRVHYFETEVIGSMQEMIILMGDALGMAGFDEAVADIATRMFRASLQGEISKL